MKHILNLFILSFLLCFQAQARLIVNKQVITNCSMNATSVCTSSVMNIQGLDDVAFEASWVSTPNGTINVQVSNDTTVDSNSIGQWENLVSTISNITDGSIAVSSAVNSVSVASWNGTNLGFRWIRLIYTNISQSGTLNVFFAGKSKQGLH